MEKEQGWIRIRNRRKQLKLTLKDMANRLHMSRSGYYYIEKGERKLTMERAKEIADALETHPAALFPEFFSLSFDSRNEKKKYEKEVSH